jgi:hypothetical protein
MAAATTGMGAGSTSKIVSVNVLTAITLTDPTGLNSGSDSGVAWTPGTPDVLELGELQPTDQAVASLTWRVTTGSPGGYSMQIKNAGTAPLIQGGAGSMADMGTTPAPLDLTKTHFGVAAGDPTNHAETSVDYPASPWGASGASGTQGTLYAGIPTTGMQVAAQSSGATNDPVTLNFAAVTAASQALPGGAYSGKVLLTASTA